MSAVELTALQKQVLQFIADRHAKHEPVRMTDICERFGWSSPNSAWVAIAALKKKGALKEGEVLVKKPGLVVTDLGREALR